MDEEDFLQFQQQIESFGISHNVDDPRQFYSALMHLNNTNLPNVRSVFNRDIAEKLYKFSNRPSADRLDELGESYRDAMRAGEESSASSSGMSITAAPRKIRATLADRYGSTYDKNTGELSDYDEDYEYISPRPGWKEAEREKRWLYRQNFDGEWRVLDGQVWPGPSGRKRGVNIGEAAEWEKERAQIISTSLAGPHTDWEAYGQVKSSGNVNLNLAGFGTPVANGPRPAQPRNKGKYARKSFIDVNLNDNEELQKSVGEAMKKEIIKNFNASDIKENTGTLKRAVEQSEVKISTDADGKGIHVSITLANLTRPPSPGRDEEFHTKDANGKPVTFQPEVITTAQYGPWVFEGRGAILARGQDYLRFYTGKHEYGNNEFGGWHTTRNVLPSKPHPDVYNFSETNIENVYDRLLFMYVEAVKVINENQFGGGI